MVSVTDIINSILLGTQIAMQAGQIGLIYWIICHDGWIYFGRRIGFRIDLRIVHYISTFYDYFIKMLDRDIFNQEVAGELIKNVYVFIGVIMVFRLMMLLMKYLINPDLTSDAKLGVNSFIKRVILGCVGILFIPTIFDLSLELQSAIIKDNLIQKIVIPKDILPRISRVQQRGGKYIATFIQAGFISPKSTAPNYIKTMYDTGVKNGDLSVLKSEMNNGIFQNVDNYDINYVPIVSTLVLAYALMTMAKYCIDLATRCLRLLLYKLLTPVAMIEYMIKGADDGVFKKWKTAIISTYVALFVRVMALWFVIFVTGLMQFDPNNKYIANSLLDNPNDTLLRAIIIVALLGFMMDLPKLVGSVFDLDLEQAGNADGLFKTITGIAKTGYIGGLGVAAMNAANLASIGASGIKGLGAFADKRRNLTDADKDKWKSDHQRAAAVMDFLDKNPFANSIVAQRANTTKGLMGLSPITKSLYEGGSSAWGGTLGAYDKKESSEKEKTKAKQAEERDVRRAEREEKQEKREEARDILHELERGADIGRYRHSNGTPYTLREIQEEMMKDYTSGKKLVTEGEVGTRIENSLSAALLQASRSEGGNGTHTITADSLAAVISERLGHVGIHLTREESTSLAGRIFASAAGALSDGGRGGMTIGTQANADALQAQFDSQYDRFVGQIVETRLGINASGGVNRTTVSRGTSPDISTIEADGNMVSGINNERITAQREITVEVEEAVKHLKSIDKSTRGSYHVERAMRDDIHATRGAVEHIDANTDVIVDQNQNLVDGQTRIEGQVRGIGTDVHATRDAVEHIDTNTNVIVNQNKNLVKGQTRIEGQIRGIKRDTGNIDKTTKDIKKDTNDINDKV